MKRPKRPKYWEPKSPELQGRNWNIVGARMMGATIRALAKGTGLSRTHVHRIVAGVPVLQPKPKRPRKSRARPERWMRYFDMKCQARALRKLGYSYSEIARQLGISRGCAFNAARMVKVAELHGHAWLSHHQGRPKEWKRELLARTTTPNWRNPVTKWLHEEPRPERKTALRLESRFDTGGDGGT